MSENNGASGNSAKTGSRRMGGPMGGGPMGMMVPGEKAKNFKITFKRLVKELKPYRVRFTIIILMALISTVFSISAPKISSGIIDELFKTAIGIKPDFTIILNIVITLGILYVISSAFTYLQQYLMVGVSQNIVYKLRKDISQKLSRLPLKFFDSRTHGEILSRVTNDLDNVSNTLQQSITQIVTSVATLIGVIVMMISISGWLTLVTLITLPLYGVVTFVIIKRSQKYFSAQQKALGEINGHVEEMYTAHKIVKVFGREQDSINKFKEINKRYYNHSWKAQFISGVIMPLMSFISNLGYVFVCILGGYLAAQKLVTLGDISAFMIYARQFTMPIVQTANIANIIQSTIASAERVYEILDEVEEKPDSIEAIRLNDVNGSVKFDHVHFGYKEDKILMSDLNIEVTKGQTIAIVGPTGAGKTTLVNLLMRFYEIQGGTITIDGNNINDIARSDLRSVFGMVLQDTWLFNGTLAENISYANESATMDEIVAAAKSAQADHFIRTLPDGYKTILNEEASNISQGQKQLLTIARAILANPSILILDEATSSVDTRTEYLIQKAMNTLMKGRTSFVIAHRLSTIKDADIILVMNNGDVIEKGTHIELLEAKGFYADLYYSQFAGANLEL